MESPEPGLFDVIAAEVRAQGLELVEASIGSAGKRSVLRVVIYSPSGVSHGDCERVARAIHGRQRDPAGPIPAEAALEVSSPGIDRVLKDQREFDLFRGARLRVWLAGAPVREVVGTSEGTREGQSVALRVEGGEEEIYPWDSVTKARLLPETEARKDTGT